MEPVSGHDLDSTSTPRLMDFIGALSSCDKVGGPFCDFVIDPSTKTGGPYRDLRAIELLALIFPKTSNEHTLLLVRLWVSHQRIQ